MVGKDARSEGKAAAAMEAWDDIVNHINKSGDPDAPPPRGLVL